MTQTVIIAEIGECFNGDLNIAERLIVAAKDAGCDIVKFQTLDGENISANDPEREWFEKIALDQNKIRYLSDYAGEKEIGILFTPENRKTAKWLLQAGHDSIKIASSTMHDPELLDFINDNFSVVYVSTGMASLDEVNDAVRALDSVERLFVMHCISEYPTGPLLEQRGLKALDHLDVRLNMMKMLKMLYPDLIIGYSDHTAGILAPIAAVAAGAEIIEKHITLDRNTPVRNFLEGREYLGTDHVLSIEPEELTQMVLQIREVEKMLGPWRWERSEGEKVLREFLRCRFSDDT